MAPKKAPAKGKGKTPPKGKSKASPAKSEKSATPTKGGDDAKAVEGSLDFEAGIIFNRYDKSGAGVLTAAEFREMWKQEKEALAKASAGGTPMTGGTGTPPSHVQAMLSEAERKLSFSSAGDVSFEAGKVFSQFDGDKDGRITKDEFERLVKNHPELLRSGGGVHSSRSQAQDAPELPVEIVSGRLLTHFDETAGVAIPRTAVDEHKTMGNVVSPLVEAYRARYDRLRSLLTAKLLPRREHLLQLRRQLTNCSAEVTASKQAIERETKTDTEQILDRLRSVESMRQSAITHQVLQLDEELQAIERCVRRVEQANDVKTKNAVGVGGGISLVTTSAAVGHATLESVRAPQAALMVEVIQQFADLSSSIDKLSTKPIEVQVEFATDDFPKETAERLEVIARCDRYAHALSVKDHMLWTALKEKEKLGDQLEEERALSQEYAAEVAKWAELAQSLAAQLAVQKQETGDMESQVGSLVNILREHNIHVTHGQ